VRIAIIGTGYVGLVTGACLASLGLTVECIDRDAERVAQLRRGEVPFYEPGLAELLAQCRLIDSSGTPSLRFSTPDVATLSEADVVFLAVGTPTSPDGQSADLRALTAAAEDTARQMRSRAVLIIKSTTPVGTGDAVARLVASAAPQSFISVASNPEFLREGRAVEDFLSPSRVVIGCDSEHAEMLLKCIYEPLLENGVPLIATTRRTAELIKYASNAFLATKLAFINEIADLCELAGTDVEAVSQGMGLDPRIGSQYLQAGPGHGGSCLPKDLLALAHTGRQFGINLQLVEAVKRVNEEHQARMIEKIEAACGGNVEGKTISFLGLAFKPETDDVRKSPAVALISMLLERGAHIRATDPQALHNTQRLLPGLDVAENAYACAVGADVLVLATDWDEYRELDFARLRAAVRTPSLVDLRNALPASAVRAAGFSYVGVGRASLTIERDDS